MEDWVNPTLDLPNTIKSAAKNAIVGAAVESVLDGAETSIVGGLVF